MLLACTLLAAGCHRESASGNHDIDASDTEATLPKPEAGAGSVTGLPGAGAGGERTRAPTPAEPSADDAATIVRIYYGAIDTGAYDRAYQLWSGGGRSSGQSAAEFAAGFAATTGVSVQTGTPGRIEGAAGSRYVTVPVTIQASHQDGSNHRYAGTYTLRRAVVDGASEEQRAWRIESADLRELP